MIDWDDPALKVPVKIWFCPANHKHRVEWTGSLATCLDCGFTNVDMDVCRGRCAFNDKLWCTENKRPCSEYVNSLRVPL